MIRKASLLVLAGIAVVSSFGLTAQAAHALDDLIEATPAAVSIVAPGPGESEDWSMSVQNLTSNELPLTLAISGSSETLFSGAHQLELELTDSRTGAIVYRGTAADAMDSQIDLPVLGASGTYELSGTATLPALAGNEYQGASAQLSLEFRTIMNEQPPEEGGLAITGAAFEIMLWIAGLALAAGIVALLLRKKKV